MGRTLWAMAMVAATAAGAEAAFIPVDGMVIAGPAMPTPAETLAVRHLNRELERITGTALPVTWGDESEGRPRIVVGTAATLGDHLAAHGWTVDAPDGDARSQSYVVAGTSDGATPVVVAAGFGTERTPRGALGLGYAVGELVRRLNVRDGAWGFELPAEAIVKSPAMPNRTLYLMNSNNSTPGLSLEYFAPEEIEAYVDSLIAARYSRISLWQWNAMYLYPGNNEEQRARNVRVHQTMRSLFGYARRRGLEVYHQLTPMHANPDLLPDDPKYVATGYYGRSSVCWSQPEARELARNMARHEMEHYGPVDGYIVWFYDPGGCFCESCKANQAQNLFEQLTLVVDLAKSISPEAQFEAVLWPTWCFHEYQDRGIPMTKEETETFVKAFLAKALEAFGPRNLTIMDTCELEHSNLYNGLVDPEQFQRCAFMYTVMGMASEHGYPFASWRFRHLAEKMGRARDRGLEDGNFFIQYAATNYPAVFAFADLLYERGATWEDTLRRYAATAAKGDAYEPYVQLLSTLEESAETEALDAREPAISRAEELLEQVLASEHFVGNRDWLRGQVLSQRHYLEMARTQDDAGFQRALDAFRQHIGAIAMYQKYMENLMPETVTRLHLRTYWQGPEGSQGIVGVPVKD